MFRGSLTSRNRVPCSYQPTAAIPPTVSNQCEEQFTVTGAFESAEPPAGAPGGIAARAAMAARGGAGYLDDLNPEQRQAVETLEQIVGWMCDAPARVWDMVDKGRIEVGYDADLVLVDLQKSAVIRDEEQETKVKWSPWHGETITGWPVTR